MGDTTGRGRLAVGREAKLPKKSIWVYPLVKDFLSETLPMLPCVIEKLQKIKEKPEHLIWSQLLDKLRTHFEARVFKKQGYFKPREHSVTNECVPSCPPGINGAKERAGSGT